MAGVLIFLICCLGFVSRVSAQQDRATDRRIRFFQQKLKDDPDYYAGYNRLASAYLQKARESGDLTYYELAEKTIRKSLELESTHPEAAGAFSLASAIDFAEHKFQKAADEGERALQLDPLDRGSYASTGDAYMEMGDYEKAKKYFSRLSSEGRFRPGLTYLELTRKASLALALGRPEEAVLELRSAVEAGDQASLPPENLAWTQFTLGETYLQVGDLSHAEAAFMASLARFPAYHRALAGLAKLRVCQKRYPEAIVSYQKAMEVIPLPVYAAALGDIYRKTGNPDQAKKQYQLVDYIASLSFLSKTVYNRELALFYADHDLHVDRAADLAGRESQIRHDIYTKDILAWALYKSGKLPEAMAAISQIAQYSPRDPIVLFHWGMIQDAAGNIETSDIYLRQALALNPEFHIFYADRARAVLRQHEVKIKARGE